MSELIGTVVRIFQYPNPSTITGALRSCITLALQSRPPAGSPIKSRVSYVEVSMDNDQLAKYTVRENFPHQIKWNVRGYQIQKGDLIAVQVGTPTASTFQRNDGSTGTTIRYSGHSPQLCFKAHGNATPAELKLMAARKTAVAASVAKAPAVKGKKAPAKVAKVLPKAKAKKTPF